MELLCTILCATATEELLSLLMKTPQPDPEKPANSQLPFPRCRKLSRQAWSHKSDWGKEEKTLCHELFLPLDEEQTLFLSHLKALSAVHGMFWCYLAAVAGTRTPQWKAPILPEGHNQCSEIRNLALILIPHLRCSTKNVLRWSCYLRQQRYKPLDEPQKKFSPAPPFSGMEPLPPRWASTCTGTAETTKAFWESTERKTVLGTTPTSDFDPNHHGFCSFWTWKCHEVL